MDWKRVTINTTEEAYWDYVDAEAVLAARQPCVRV